MRDKKYKFGKGNLMALAAFRYCLPKRNYIVKDCVQWLKSNWKSFEDHTQNSIVEEIAIAIKEDMCGDKIDLDLWRDLLIFADQYEKKKKAPR